MRPVSVRLLDRRELDQVLARPRGWVLVDHQASGSDRPSILHAASCAWLRRIKNAPVRFAESPATVGPWLLRQRGPEGLGWKRCPSCEALPPQATTRALPERDTGETVWTLDRGRDLGVTADVTGDSITVGAFDSPERPFINERQVVARQLSTFTPSVGDRCFVEREGAWTPAVFRGPDPNGWLVVDDHGGTQVAQPTGVRFRRLSPLQAPLEDLAAHRTGEVARSATRSAFLTEYYTLAEAARGMDAIASAAIALHVHQVSVARRVLADPVQRYLLADEVGLGKTIEAGLIIRQRLIDAPRSGILVLVPEPLLWQWEDELDAKFGVREFRRGGIEVASYDDPRALRRTTPPDLVVIDEAHRVAAGFESPVPEHAERYEAIRAIAHDSPRVLVLSATPVLHHERDLLAMLHLLDPDAHPLDDIDAFVRRVRDRENLGRLFLGVAPDTPAFLLAAPLRELRAAYPQDNRLHALLDRVEHVSSDDHARASALADVRVHLSETYRLHHRLLRNRRATIAGSSYRVRGRAGVDVVDDGDARRTKVEDWLEEWRSVVLEDAFELEIPEDKASALFWLFVQAASGDLEVLRNLAVYRLELKRQARHAAGLTPEEAALIRGIPTSDRQRTALRRVAGLLEEVTAELAADDAPQPSESLQNIASALRRPGLGDRVVAFTTATPTARALERLLTRLWSNVTVLGCTREQDHLQRREVIAAFGRAQRAILICDASAEEGLNLQMADRVIHADLPVTTSRVEQRLGRVDRFSEGEAIASTAVAAGQSDAYVAAWLHALRDGFLVFSTSTASVQYAIEAVERSFLIEAFQNGVLASSDLTRRLADAVQAEQARIDRVDSLDALASQERDDAIWVERVTEVERDHGPAFARAVRETVRAYEGDLGPRLVRRREGGDVVDIFRRTPAIQIHSALAEAPIGTTAERPLAVADPELGLLRPGSPLVEALKLQLAGDDRAQLFALWHTDEQRHHDLLAIRAEVVVRADPADAFALLRELETRRSRSARARRSDADAPLDLAAVRRRVDEYLPPRLVQLWLHGDASLITDRTELDALELAVAAAEGDAWSDRAWTAAFELAGVLSAAALFGDFDGAVREHALAAAGDEQAFIGAARRAEEAWRDVQHRVRMRAELTGDATAKLDLEHETLMAEALVGAIRHPIVEWNSAGLVALSGRGLP